MSMRTKPNPRAIGIFVVISLVLLVSMIFYFASSSLFTLNTRYILFFDQSVNGLNLGSPVKFRGVPVGAVEQILIRADGQAVDSTAIPVVISIDQTRLTRDLGLSDDLLSPMSIERTIERGLVARLNLESFVTGQLFVDFSLEPDKIDPKRVKMQRVDDLIVIPTVGSSLDEITSDVAEIIAKVGDLDIALLADNLNAVMSHTAEVMAGIESKQISQSITRAADEFSKFMTSDEGLKTTMNSIQLAIQDLREVVQTYRLDEGPMVARLDQFSQTLAGLDRLSAEASNLIAPDSKLMYEITTTLRELNRTAESIRELTDFLERNPGALITGRASDTE